jgi:hypothetical protein
MCVGVAMVRWQIASTNAAVIGSGRTRVYRRNLRFQPGRRPDRAAGRAARQRSLDPAIRVRHHGRRVHQHHAQHAELFRHKLTVPSVHVTGRADAIVPRRDSILLADRFADPLIIEHPGGHVIPSGTGGRHARSWPRA